MNWTGMTFFERVSHIVKHGERIFVRAEVVGKWSSVALSELPDAMLIAELIRLALRDVEPTRVVD